MDRESFLKKIASIFSLDNKVVKILKRPEKVIEVNFVVGDLEVEGYRVIYSTIRGPGKGGIRYSSSVNREEVENLAFWMTIKNSLMNLPYGGAKGGIKIEPKSLDEKTLEIITRRFVDYIFEFLGEDKDIPAPDVGTNEKVMAWILDEYIKLSRRFEYGVVTGKPTILGGIELRKISTSLGGWYVLEEFLNHLKIKVKSVAIQGFGNVGLNFAKVAYENGLKVIAVSDSKGGIFNPEGLNIEEVIKVKREKGSVIYYENAKKISNEELLELDVDLLVPAAIENVINEKNAERINSNIILELANGPIKISVEKKILNKGIIIIPDILANSGGVLASYFEWKINKGAFIGNLESVFRSWIKNQANRVIEMAKEYNVNFREASYGLALKRIEEALKLRGY